MRHLIILTVVLAAAAPGQWLETTIEVPLSPRGLCYNSRENKVYCACDFSNCIIVIDGATNQVIDTVEVDFYPWKLCYNPTSNKVYCANYGWGTTHFWTVTIIDGTADTVIASPYVGCGPSSLCHNLQDNKVYVYCIDDTIWVSVIDGESDSVAAWLVSDVACVVNSTLCYNCRNNKIYSASGHFASDIAVIDGATDTVLATLPVDQGCHVLCYNDSMNKVYASTANFGGSVGGMMVIDGARDSVIATLQWGIPPWDPCFASRRNKVYCANGYDRLDSTVSVIDCSTDSVVATVVLGRPTAWPALCYDPLNDKVYATASDSCVTVIDCSADTVLNTIPVGWGPVAMCHNAAQSRVYVASFAGISVIRDSVPGGVAEQAKKPEAGRAGPTVRRGPELRRMDCRVLDALGRDVTDRKHALGPGVYFLHEAGSREPVSKVIVTR